jgi:cobalt/nickel transport system ATP-binding protein
MSPLLELDDLHFCYPGGQEPALRGASLRLRAGKKVVLLGRNGSGKTTLLLHGNGILRPTHGQICLGGQPVTYDRPGLQAWRRRVGLVFQNPDDQIFSASVFQDISFGPLNLGLDADEARSRVQQAAELCELTELLERPTHALSGGQKTRVALAGVLAMEPDLLLADEVTSGLDPWMRRQVFAIFAQLVHRGKTVLLSTHDTAVARHWADIVVVMAAGRVVAADAPGQIFGDPVLRAEIEPADPWYTPSIQ